MKAFNVGDTCLYVPDLSAPSIEEYTITNRIADYSRLYLTSYHKVTPK